jgi:hypothetical protein
MTINVTNSPGIESRPMRRFYLSRLEDETGISATGRVLEGVLTQTGKVIVEWRPPHSTITIFNSLEEFKAIHVDAHPSHNEIVWLDD